MKRCILLFAFLAVSGQLLSCQSMSSRSPAEVSRDQSQLNKSSDEISLYLEGQPVQYVQAPQRGFHIESINNAYEIAKLIRFIAAHQTLMGVDISTVLQFMTLSVNRQGDKTIVRLQQVIEREVNKKKYIIPIASSSVVATIVKNRLDSLNCVLKNPPNVSFVFERPGFDTYGGFSEKQMATLVRYIRANEKQVRGYLTTLAANNGIPFKFDEFLAMEPAKQLKAMRVFFLSIKKTSTFKIIIELAQQRRLALIDHGGHWMYQVTQFMGLPIQFDILIPDVTDTSKRLKVRNLRDLIRTVEIQVYSQPDFPGGDKDLRVKWNDRAGDAVTFPTTQATDNESAKLFYDVAQYFRGGFKWIGFNGKDESTAITIVKDIKGPPWNENAFWYKEGNFLGIGSGGESLSHLHRSISTLGHEYTHAIIDNSSALEYRGQSGALNEHFADIQGISAEASITKKPFDYTLGEDILNAVVADPQKDVIAEQIKKYSSTEVEHFNLNEVALRNIYSPAVSIFQQLATMDEVNARYPETCEPSVDNDSCGVHYTAGVPSRAAAMIIDGLGFEKTRMMFFNTMAYRLGTNATFQEYLRQLYEECLVTPGLNAGSDCPVVIASFEKVGVHFPTTPPSEEEKPKQLPEVIASYCGHFSIAKMNNYVLIDNKMDALVILAKNGPRFSGKFTNVEAAFYNQVNGTSCGCLKGTVQRVQNDKGTWVNYFSQILNGTFTKQPESACAGIDLH